jgi:hypothetical protein
MEKMANSKWMNSLKVLLAPSCVMRVTFDTVQAVAFYVGMVMLTSTYMIVQRCPQSAWRQ